MDASWNCCRTAARIEPSRMNSFRNFGLFAAGGLLMGASSLRIGVKDLNAEKTGSLEVPIAAGK